MIAGLLELVKELSNEYKNQGIDVLINSPYLPHFQQLVEHLKHVTPKHVGIDNNNHHEYFPQNKTTYFNILEEADFCVGVFCLPKGCSLNLHDHPNMLVVSKFLLGSVHYRSMDLVDRTHQVSLPKLLLQDECPDVVGKRLEAIVKAEKVFGGDEINFLTPEKGNIHKFTALEDTAILDILLPNYNEDDHYCNYYIEEMELEEGNGSFFPMNLGFNFNNHKKESLLEEEKDTADEVLGECPNKNKGSRKAKTFPGPGEMTTVIYSLPPLEQEIELLPYRGEKFDNVLKKLGGTNCIKTTNK